MHKRFYEILCDSIQQGLTLDNVVPSRHLRVFKERFCCVQQLGCTSDNIAKVA